jgi:hypothetical protein
MGVSRRLFIIEFLCLENPAGAPDYNILFLVITMKPARMISFSGFCYMALPVTFAGSMANAEGYSTRLSGMSPVASVRRGGKHQDRITFIIYTV